MNLSQTVGYYSREDVQQAILSMASGREVVGVFKNGSFDTRPNTINNGSEISVLARAGAIEFHCSVERWKDVMGLKQANYEGLRSGWDLVLDIDSPALQFSKPAAMAICQAIEQHGIKGYWVKFSGNKGFHICVPWEAFPKSIAFQDSAAMFPEVARKIAGYLKDQCRAGLEKALLRKWSPEALAEGAGKPLAEVMTETGIDPFQVADIDPILISPRHLFRMPYSLNRKAFLVSLPIAAKEIADFAAERAKPEVVKALPFLRQPEAGEANLLVAEALDWHAKQQRLEKKGAAKVFEDRAASLEGQAVSEGLFPPCIKTILKGVSDGRKRSAFILLNFLASIRWGHADIEQLVLEWNQKNTPPLPDSYLRGQLRYQQTRQKRILPPNCLKEGYYREMGICAPDQVCVTPERMRNPAGYPLKVLAEQKPASNRKRPG
ncbi:MAG: hypothetical protein HY519_03830 [Candidatus Aenigmarchaeota archaeon]|nr:hypothetical protein [Candidatus Aenigmarchaeota archaeon]